MASESVGAGLQPFLPCMRLSSRLLLVPAEKPGSVAGLDRRAAGQRVREEIAGERLYKYLWSSLVFCGPVRVGTRFGHLRFVDGVGEAARS